jgi:hypothetical protein
MSVGVMLLLPFLMTIDGWCAPRRFIVACSADDHAAAVPACQRRTPSACNDRLSDHNARHRSGHLYLSTLVHDPPSSHVRRLLHPALCIFKLLIFMLFLRYIWFITPNGAKTYKLSIKRLLKNSAVQWPYAIAAFFVCAAGGFGLFLLVQVFHLVHRNAVVSKAESDGLNALEVGRCRRRRHKQPLTVLTAPRPLPSPLSLVPAVSVAVDGGGASARVLLRQLLPR